MQKYRRKVRVKRAKNYAVSLFVLLLVIGGILVIVYNQEANSRRTGLYELTENDVFTEKPDFTSRDISVLGVRLGDNSQAVYTLLGQPDTRNIYEPNILNIEYGRSMGMDETGLLIHFESGIVTRITIMEPFNRYLKGSTKIQYSKDDILKMFGSTSSARLGYPFKEYNYNSRGLTFIVDRDQQVGLSFFLY